MAPRLMVDCFTGASVARELAIISGVLEGDLDGSAGRSGAAGAAPKTKKRA